MSLRDLDARFMPWAAKRLAGFVNILAVRRTRARALRSGLSLRALDERYAGRGPLALLREVPQVGFVLIAAVFLVGAGAAVSRQGDRPSHPAQLGTTHPRANRALGPPIGGPVRTYLSTVASGLQRAEGDDDRLALVSFVGYRTPARTATLLSGLDVRRVYLRAHQAGRQAAQLPVEIKSDLLGELSEAYALAAESRRTAQQEFQQRSREVTSPDQQAFKAQYAAFARSAGIEAKAYAVGCACAYAAIIQTTVTSLRRLATDPGVRGIEVADADVVLADLQVLTLLPETTGRVPARQSDPAGQ